MSDYSIRAPQLHNAQRENEGAYQRFLSWLSMSKPGLWRLRIDIMVINYILLGAAALMAPVLMQPFSGINPDSYCGNNSRVGTCTGYVNSYVWSEGFSAGEIMLTTMLFVVAAAVLTLIWAFFVSRGTRLRGLVVQSSFPGFMVTLLVLMPMVLLPMLAGLAMFVVTHGGGLGTLITGVVDVGTLSVAFPGERHYSPEDQLFANWVIILFLFGGFFAFVTAISMKIILADGVMGLVKSIVIAAILAAITVTIGVFVFQGRVYQNTLIQLILLLTFGIFYYLWFRMSLIRNRRSKLSRTIGLSFSMYWIGWFPLVCIYFFDWIELSTETIDPWLVAWSCGLFYALFLSFTFRDISRINLLPQP